MSRVVSGPNDFRFVTSGLAGFEAAADVYARYGKGRDVAGLNMGD